MKRRSFLKTLPVLAAAPLALSAIQTRPISHPRHLISLGTAASRMITIHSKNLDFETFTLIDRESPLSSEMATKFIQFTPPESIYKQIEHLRIVKKEPLPILPLPIQIDAHLRNLEGELVFYEGLGCATGTLLFQSIGLHYQNHSQKLEWLARMPFIFEGSQKREMAERAIHLLADNRREPTCLYLDEMRNRYGNLAIRSAYEKGDEWVLDELNEGE